MDRVALSISTMSQELHIADPHRMTLRDELRMKTVSGAVATVYKS